MNNNLTKEQKDNLDRLATKYSEISDRFDIVDAEKKAYNMIIKEAMSEYSLTSVQLDSGLGFRLSSRKNEKVDEEALIATLKRLGKEDGIVKTKEYVDMDALESAIYNDKIKKEDISKCFIIKPDVVSLYLTKNEVLNE